jgi:cell division protease FtsH
MASENKKSNKNDSGSNGSPQRFQPKVLLVYLIIVAVILTIWFANPGAGSNVKQLTISELVEAVKDGQIAEDDGVMEPEPSYGRDGYVISGEMINPRLTDAVDGLTPASEAPAKIRFSARGRLTEDDFLLVREVLHREACNHRLSGCNHQLPSISAHRWPALFPLRAPAQECR